MTRPQKCKRGLRQSQISLISSFENYDPTAEMQKGIKTVNQFSCLCSIYIMMTRPQKCKRGLRHYSQLEELLLVENMTRPQKCKRGLRLTCFFQVSPYDENDPTAEMQKGIKTIKTQFISNSSTMTRPQKCKRGLRPFWS